MKSEVRSFVIRAKYVLPICQDPIENGVIEVVGNRVVRVASRRNETFEYDLGEAAILPQLVNPHTHLEFSDLQEPLGERGLTFPDWIRKVIRHRIEKGASLIQSSEPWKLGLAESVNAGVGLIGDIATGSYSLEQLSQTLASKATELVAFREVLGAKQEAIARLKEIGSCWLNTNPQLFERAGLSPHAPYSLSWQAFLDACDAADLMNRPIAMHLAESKEEMELLATNQGPMRKLMDDLGAWDDSRGGDFHSASHYLARLAKCTRALIIHGNYLTAEQLQEVGNSRSNTSLVYCPRTHDYFEHDRWPMVQAIAAGVRICLGTDSRATNPDLNLWREAQFVAKAFPQLNPLEILKMITIHGAEALGKEAQFGAIGAGRPFGISVVERRDRGTLRIEELLSPDTESRSWIPSPVSS